MNNPLVRIVWNDASDTLEPWVSEEGLKKFSLSTALVVSVGYLAHKNRSYITIAGDWQEDCKIWGRVTKIPRRMVVSIEEIHETVVPAPTPAENPCVLSNHERD